MPSMEIRRIQRAAGILLACYSTVFGTSAFAGESVICDSTFQLRKIHQQSSLTQSISSPLEVITILNRFTTDLKIFSARNSNSAMGRLSDDLSGMVAELGNVTGVQHQDFDAIGSSLFRNLSDHMANLNLVEGIFGCAKAELSLAEFKTPNARYVNRISVELPSKISGVSAIAASYSVIAIFLFLISIFVAFRLNRRRQDVRKFCRTSMLIVYGNQCTVTHIIDMNRSGMKIEAAQKDVEKVWVDLYFCGHKVQGKIIWRNTYFAGIKFKTRVDQQTLDDVMEKSRKPLGESGLEKNATPCFSIGCHTNCPRHLPTAISEK
jgi:hypothetical protein